MKKQHFRSQKRIGKARKPVNSSVIDAIERELEKEMRRYEVSRSFVIARALAFTFNIDEQEDYKPRMTLVKRAR